MIVDNNSSCQIHAKSASYIGYPFHYSTTTIATTTIAATTTTKSKAASKTSNYHSSSNFCSTSANNGNYGSATTHHVDSTFWSCSNCQKETMQTHPCQLKMTTKMKWFSIMGCLGIFVKMW